MMHGQADGFDCLMQRIPWRGAGRHKRRRAQGAADPAATRGSWQGSSTGGAAQPSQTKSEYACPLPRSQGGSGGGDALETVEGAQAAAARLQHRHAAHAAAEAACASPEGPPDGIVAVKVKSWSDALYLMCLAAILIHPAMYVALTCSGEFFENVCHASKSRSTSLKG